MLPFLGFSALYPLNLYIFEFFSKQFLKCDPIKIKVVSVLFSTSILLAYLNVSSFTFSINISTFYWSVVGLLPFLIPLIYAEADEEPTSFLFWRNFVISPACEELYYRILLPQLCNSVLALSISFSAAHAHPLLFPKNWSKPKLKTIAGQCCVSFCFGIICNKVRIKSEADHPNLWLFLALALIHGVANYCGVPIIPRKNIINSIHMVILVISIYLILK